MSARLKSPEERIAAAVTLLFVPADRPDRFDKALASGADLVIVDLEDAVAPSAKDAARQTLAGWLDADKPVLVRLNAADTTAFANDMALTAHPGVLGLVLPKATAGEALAAAAAAKPTIALVESAQGVADLAAIAATPGVVRLAIGAIDLAGDVGLGPDDSLLDPVRLQMTFVSRLAGLTAPIDGVTPTYTDAARVAGDVARTRALGFGGKLCIHPLQLAMVRAGFTPTADEIAWAKRMVAADAAAGGAAVSVDGAMVDKPVVDRARRILASISA